MRHARGERSEDGKAIGLKNLSFEVFSLRDVLTEPENRRLVTEFDPDGRYLERAFVAVRRRDPTFRVRERALSERRDLIAEPRSVLGVQ